MQPKRLCIPGFDHHLGFAGIVGSGSKYWQENVSFFAPNLHWFLSRHTSPCCIESPHRISALLKDFVINFPVVRDRSEAPYQSP